MRSYVALTFALLLCVSHSSVGFADDVPHTPTSLGAPGGLSEAQANQIIAKVQKVYAPLVQKLGLPLVIQFLWDENYPNAFVTPEPKKGQITLTLTGGRARHPMTTQDGLMLSLCHEMGHLFGGYPKLADAPWASIEAAADYYASLKCMRKVLAGEDNIAAVKKLQGVPASVMQNCAASHKDPQMSALCVRSSMAGLSFARYYQDFLPFRPAPDFWRVEKSARQIMTNYPNAQCRLETFVQGALCGVDAEIPQDDFDPRVGACHLENGDQIGNRPLCWFKP